LFLHLGEEFEVGGGHGGLLSCGGGEYFGYVLSIRSTRAIYHCFCRRSHPL
jgi:hypothetical protein